MVTSYTGRNSLYFSSYTDCINTVRWKKKMIQPIQPEDPFTAQARRRWEKIPKWAQKKILDNVFCGRCLGSVPILLETAEMKGKDLILRGKCQHCGKNICRVVEPETEWISGVTLPKKLYQSQLEYLYDRTQKDRRCTMLLLGILAPAVLPLALSSIYLRNPHLRQSTFFCKKVV